MCTRGCCRTSVDERMNPPSGPALRTSKVSTYVPSVAFFQGQHFSPWFFMPAYIHWQHFTSFHINFLHFIFQNLSCQHFCSRFVQTSFAVSMWSWKYLWSNMFTNHSLFWRIKLENGTRRRDCEWRSVWRKCQILAMTTPQENWKCLHRYTTKLMNDCSILMWWNIGNEHTSY